MIDSQREEPKWKESKGVWCGIWESEMERRSVGYVCFLEQKRKMGTRQRAWGCKRDGTGKLRLRAGSGTKKTKRNAKGSVFEEERGSKATKQELVEYNESEKREIVQP